LPEAWHGAGLVGVPLDAGGLAGGVYVVRLTAGLRTAQMKVVLVR